MCLDIPTQALKRRGREESHPHSHIVICVYRSLPLHPSARTHWAQHSSSLHQYPFSSALTLFLWRGSRVSSDSHMTVLLPASLPSIATVIAFVVPDKPHGHLKKTEARVQTQKKKEKERSTKLQKIFRGKAPESEPREGPPRQRQGSSAPHTHTHTGIAQRSEVCTAHTCTHACIHGHTHRGAKRYNATLGGRGSERGRGSSARSALEVVTVAKIVDGRQSGGREGKTGGVDARGGVRGEGSSTARRGAGESQDRKGVTDKVTSLGRFAAGLYSR